MVHRVKCDGEIFDVLAGYLHEILSNVDAFMADGIVDYKLIKSYVKEGRIPRDAPHTI